MRKLITLFIFLALGVPASAEDLIVPNPALTPGEISSPAVSVAVLCQPGYSKSVRHVSNALKAQILRSYGYDPQTIKRGDYEIDHLLPLELGGSNGIKNLWPQSYVTQPMNAHRKDVLENLLHHLVCSHELDLATAQHDIMTDWVAAYRKYVLHQTGT